jgi:putative phosphoserine phosphatase/1-acylglycerol-3-phosphate O-acyltransferase
VEVVVHPPVPTTDWRPDTIDRHVADVRALFVDTLER